MVPESLRSVFSTLYYLSIWSIFSSASVFYIYCKLNCQKISIQQSIRVSLNKFADLLLWKTLQVVLIYTFIIPRLSFVTWAIMIENYSLEDALRRSWNLTRGYGWQIFGSYVAFALGARAATTLSSGLIAAAFGVSLTDLSQPASITDLPSVVAKVADLGLSLFLIQPISLMFYMLIFLYLLDVERQRLSLKSPAAFTTQTVE
ncbi:hypothetical protein H6F88_11180 [Oculatella sp. FACHB-28]|nr:hypothetical protein [Oculatella sp. FACHB-28]